MPLLWRTTCCLLIASVVTFAGFTSSCILKKAPRAQPLFQQQVKDDQSIFLSKKDNSLVFKDSIEVSDSTRSTPTKFLPGVSEKQIGIFVLATVPVVWGTYVPVVKGLYEIDPPIPGFVFSTAYFAVAAVSAFGLLSFQPSNESSLSSDDGWVVLQAGLELGFYLFLGNSLQVLGLKTITSERAGFLVQLTTIIVPIVQAALLRSSVSSRTWIACVLALAGISIMGYDGEILKTQMSSFSWPSLKDGDFLILGAAVVYSLHVVRLGRWANETSPLKLVAFKALTELILSIIALLLLTSVAPSSTGGIVPEAGLLTFAQETGLEISTFFETLQERIVSGTLTTSSIRLAVGAVLWTGLISTAYTTFAQSFGQRRVKPADANLIYSLQPIFTAIFAYFLLGETMGMYGFVGGSVIGGAVLLAASESSQQQTSTGEKIAQ
ncbi:hypothetical protein FisN_9Lh160 [Fistulifera solaris]|uniref:EamA domain-containing protein n=1 Tax=Fistulifera solaris TaxID=1519565 RepID=A0A1Z5KLH4_FISSO|nr:hypothetical protein FisN_9Lh160 [Fistulifera solaris]|eukprot:GAX26871.1 hypothetical protein FisN_9Lh160 [Fistulifera solaris]